MAETLLMLAVDTN